MTIGTATVLLFVVSALLDSASVSSTSLSGMLPVASVLAVAGLGQMLVVQQGGIDLSVAGASRWRWSPSPTCRMATTASSLPAILLAICFALGRRRGQRCLIGFLGLNAIIATLGMNALLYGVNLHVSGGRPRITTDLMARIGGRLRRGASRMRSSSPWAHCSWCRCWSRSPCRAVGSRPSAPTRGPAAPSACESRTHRGLAYVWAQLLYCLGGILIGGITAQPIAVRRRPASCCRRSPSSCSAGPRCSVAEASHCPR